MRIQRQDGCLESAMEAAVPYVSARECVRGVYNPVPVIIRVSYDVFLPSRTVCPMESILGKVLLEALVHF